MWGSKIGTATKKLTRSENLKKHIGLSLLYKLVSIVIGFVVVPLSLNILGSENYGVWLTISTFFTWFVLFDVGLGNGLRNKIAENKDSSKSSIIQGYVSTAYISLALLCAGIYIIFLFFNKYIKWREVFNIGSTVSFDVNTVIPVLFGFFLLQLIFKLIVNVYQADQNHSVQHKVNFYTQIIIVSVLGLAYWLEMKSLSYYGLIVMGAPTLVLVLYNVYSFKRKYRDYTPRLKSFTPSSFKELANLGLSFFVVQLGAVVLFSTDTFIINHLFGPSEVVPYNLAFKYFSIITLIYGIMLNPFWSTFTHAWSKNEKAWVKNTIKKIQRVWIFSIPPICLVMSLCSDYVFKIWVGSEVKVPIEIVISLSFYVSIMTFNTAYVYFVNSLGKIKLQMYIGIIVTVLNIPLSIVLAKGFNLGVPGVIIATCTCLSVGAILIPMQCNKILNNEANGIWNK